MTITITKKATGESRTMNWRGSRNYARTACSFLYNLSRSERGEFALTTEDGREINMAKACAAAAAEMNAIRNGRRVPPLPDL